MIINVATLFVEMFDAITKHSITARAIESGLVDLRVFNYRDYTDDPHRRVDDTCYGHGAGMLMRVEPVIKTLEAIKHMDAKTSKMSNMYTHVIYPSPKGKLFTQHDAKRLSKYDNITFLCGHYEGFDQRIIDNYVDEEISVGDYVLTGGELPAMCMIDSIMRLIEGVINSESADDESFSNYLLEYPHYTKPANYEGLRVPEVLLSGNHKKIKSWRHRRSLEITKNRRPDLYGKYLKSRGLV